jgi:hypothetical protein
MNSSTDEPIGYLYRLFILAHTLVDLIDGITDRIKGFPATIRIRDSDIDPYKFSAFPVSPLMPIKIVSDAAGKKLLVDEEVIARLFLLSVPREQPYVGILGEVPEQAPRL